jgi:Concanavalin A-like lectin/glucanases superfamily
MQSINSDLIFDGIDDFIEIPDNPEFSIPTTGQLTVSARIRPDVLTFPKSESTGYVHWMGKGEKGQYEWVFRMYNEHPSGKDNDRSNRISFYVFNLHGKKGIGSYFQDHDPIKVGEWIYVVGTANSEITSIYKNGDFKQCDRYTGSNSDQDKCQNYPSCEWITPERGTAPLRIGTRDCNSYFKGSICDVRIWNRTLSAVEISNLYKGTIPQSGLVAEFLLQQSIAIDSASPTMET